MIGILALLSTFECFARPAYVDIILAVLLLLIILRDCFNENYLKTVFILNILTMIMDVVWLGIYKVFFNIIPSIGGKHQIRHYLLGVMMEHLSLN